MRHLIRHVAGALISRVRADGRPIDAGGGGPAGAGAPVPAQVTGSAPRSQPGNSSGPRPRRRLRLDREARRRVRLVLAAALLALPTGHALEATDLEGLLVLRGDLYLARVGGHLHRFELAGVWAPAAPGGAKAPGYRGWEAKRRVLDLFDRHLVRVEALARPGRGRAMPVRIWIRREGEWWDLAVLLAEEGLALRERSTVADEAQARALREAESRARRDRRGMHDGGFRRFEAARRTHVDLGEIVWLQAAEPEAATVDEPGAETVAPVADEGAWWVRRNRDALRDPVEAIRDWGAAFGLPPDGSKGGG